MFWRHVTQLDRIEARLITLTERFAIMVDDFTALSQTVSDLGDAITDTATRVEADLAALQTAQQSNDQPTIDALNAKIADGISHLKAIGATASTASDPTPDTPVTVPTPPASIADPSDPTTVDTSTTAS